MVRSTSSMWAAATFLAYPRAFPMALVVGIGFSAIIEPIVEGVAPQVAKYLPGYAAQALSGSAARGISRLIPLLTWWEGTVLLLAYGVVFAAAGSLTTLRADVT